MPKLLLSLVLSAALVAACGGNGDESSDSDGPSDSDVERVTDPDELRGHEDELKETIASATKAIFGGGAVDAYGYASADFKAACPLDDFVGLIALVKVFLGEIDKGDIEVNVTEVRYEEGRAYPTTSGTIDGEDFGEDDEGGDLSDFWVYEDGVWKFSTDDDAPCDSGFDTSAEGNDEPPATGAGSSRAEPLPLGETIDFGDRRITVLEADLDAGARLEELSEFPATPESGRRVVLARVRVEHIGAGTDETVMIYDSDFKLTGSSNVLFDSFDDGVSCGFLEDDLSGEMFPGGELEGYVCFQVPEGETELLLVAEPSFSFGDGDRRYLALE